MNAYTLFASAIGAGVVIDLVLAGWRMVVKLALELTDLRW